MDLKNTFIKLAQASDYDGLLKYAQTLDQVDDYELSDKIINYVKVSSEVNQNKRFASYVDDNQRIAATLANNVNHTERIIEGPLKNIFEAIINAKTGLNFPLDKIPHIRNIFDILKDPSTKNDFYNAGYHLFTIRHDLTREHARQRLNRAWKAFVNYVTNHHKPITLDEKEYEHVKSIPNLNYSVALKILSTVAERALNRHHIEFTMGDFLNPHSAIFYDVFGPTSPVKKEIDQDLITEVGHEKAQQILNIVQEDIAQIPLNKNLMKQAVQQHHKNQTNRNYGIQHDNDLQTIMKAIELTDPNLVAKNVFNFQTEDHWKFFDAFNLNKFHENLYAIVFDELKDEVHAGEVADRLYNAVTKIHTDNVKKNPNYNQYQENYRNSLVQQEQFRKQQVVQQQERERKMHELAQQQDDQKNNIYNDIQTMIDTREQNPAYTPTKKKWWQLWKQASLEMEELRYD